MKVLILVDVDKEYIDQSTFTELALTTIGNEVIETNKFQIMVLG